MDIGLDPSVVPVRTRLLPMRVRVLDRALREACIRFS